MLKTFTLAAGLTLSASAFANPIILTEKNTVVLRQRVSSRSIAKLQSDVFNKCFKSESKHLYLVLNTPGGSVSAGRLFLDTVKSIPCKIDTLTIFSASMGYHFVQGLNKRYILPSGTLMSHRASISGLSGQLPGELITRIDYLSKLTNELDIVAAKRVKIPLKQYKKDIFSELWLTGADAVKTGHADAVKTAVCDGSLKGSTFETVRVMFFNLKVEYSKCPLIVGPLSVKAAGKREIPMEILPEIDTELYPLDSMLSNKINAEYKR